MKSTVIIIGEKIREFRSAKGIRLFEAAAKAGITSIIQPGGSIRDNDSIEACDKYNISMLFTGMRHFKH